MGIAFRKQVDDDTVFALWRIEEEADMLYKQLQLNEEEKAFAESLSKGKRYLHWLSVRVLLRMMLATDEYIDCKIDQHGKPYLVNLPYHISFSHSFDYAAVMISKTRPVGIDIEQVNQKVERIAHKFLRKEERTFLSKTHQIQQLYVCWCAKEAVYKCYGQKEVSFANNMTIEPFVLAEAGEVWVTLDKGATNITYLTKYLHYEDYMIGYVKG
jgi:phosphopantetheine--protein transferase-like protein